MSAAICPVCKQRVAILFSAAGTMTFVRHFPNQRNVISGPRVTFCPGAPPETPPLRLLPREVTRDGDA